ncbi:hypothetical protein PAECIP112173_03736 [Paenibacillus sp. JJ-100]|nr:hypothetical protein PAECIP112173_03736 [Paenibacillus sp. JJ-100]
MEDVLLQRELYGIWNISLEPFQSITASVSSYIRDPGFGVITLFLIGNILIFVPLGFLLPLLLKKPSYIKTMLISLGVIVSIETLQLVTCLGIADVDDVLSNMIGSTIGYAAYYFIEKNMIINKYNKRIKPRIPSV